VARWERQAYSIGTSKVGPMGVSSSPKRFEKVMVFEVLWSRRQERSELILRMSPGNIQAFQKLGISRIGSDFIE
jgi:hypothetical protein